MAGLLSAVSSSSSSKALAGACSGIVKRKLTAPSGATGGPPLGENAGSLAMAKDDGLTKLETPASQNTKDQNVEHSDTGRSGSLGDARRYGTISDH
eukprot:scaffold2643_cov117-Isochrysis_galbana.AAC.14